MKIAFAIALAAAATAASAQVYVKPHVTKNGTYVEGHHRTAPDSNPYNNYSTQGNTNPYTGQSGTVNPYQAPTYTAPARTYGTQCGYTTSGQYVCR